MNQLSKDIFKSWDKWYKTAVNISKIGGYKGVLIEAIKLTSKTLINDVNSMDCDNSEEFKILYCRMINNTVKVCERQADPLILKMITRKQFKRNINNLKNKLKEGYKK